MRQLSGREKFLLGVLIVGGVGWFFFWGEDGIGFGGPSIAEQDDGPPLGEPPLVRMDLLARGTTPYDPAGRNLFQYYVPPKPPPPPPPPPPPRKEVKPRVVSTPKPPPPKPRKQGPPLPKFRYLGFLGPKEDKIAVFDAGEGVWLARVGDELQKKYRLREFKFDKVVLDFLDDKWAGQTTELVRTPE